jgi:hypothetical protein
VAREPKLIGEFLTELAEKPELLAAYLENPLRVLDDFGLTEEQRETLLSNDLPRIRAAIREEYATANVLLFPFPQNIVAPSP